MLLYMASMTSSLRCDLVGFWPPFGLLVLEGREEESEDLEDDDVEAEEASPRTPLVRFLIKSIFESVADFDFKKFLFLHKNVSRSFTHSVRFLSFSNSTVFVIIFSKTKGEKT